MGVVDEMRAAAARRLSEDPVVVVLRRSDEEEARGRRDVTSDGIDPRIRETPSGQGIAAEIVSDDQ